MIRLPPPDIAELLHELLKPNELQQGLEHAAAKQQQQHETQLGTSETQAGSAAPSTCAEAHATDLSASQAQGSAVGSKRGRSPANAAATAALPHATQKPFKRSKALSTEQWLSQRVKAAQHSRRLARSDPPAHPPPAASLQCARQHPEQSRVHLQHHAAQQTQQTDLEPPQLREAAGSSAAFSHRAGDTALLHANSFHAVSSTAQQQDGLAAVAAAVAAAVGCAGHSAVQAATGQAAGNASCSRGTPTNSAGGRPSADHLPPGGIVDSECLQIINLQQGDKAASAAQATTVAAAAAGGGPVNSTAAPPGQCQAALGAAADAAMSRMLAQAGGFMQGNGAGSQAVTHILSGGSASEATGELLVLKELGASSKQQPQPASESAAAVYDVDREFELQWAASFACASAAETAEASAEQVTAEAGAALAAVPSCPPEAKAEPSVDGSKQSELVPQPPAAAEHQPTRAAGAAGALQPSDCRCAPVLEPAAVSWVVTISPINTGLTLTLGSILAAPDVPIKQEKGAAALPAQRAPARTAAVAAAAPATSGAAAAVAGGGRSGGKAAGGGKARRQTFGQQGISPPGQRQQHSEQQQSAEQQRQQWGQQPWPPQQPHVQWQLPAGPQEQQQRWQQGWQQLPPPQHPGLQQHNGLQGVGPDESVVGGHDQQEVQAQYLSWHQNGCGQAGHGPIAAPAPPPRQQQQQQQQPWVQDVSSEDEGQIDTADDDEGGQAVSGGQEQQLAAVTATAKCPAGNQASTAAAAGGQATADGAKRKKKSRGGKQVRQRQQRAAAEAAAAAAAGGGSGGGVSGFGLRRGPEGQVQAQAGLQAEIRQWEKTNKINQPHRNKALDPARDLRFAITEKPPCMFWHQGRCSKGSSCTFSHEGSPAIKLLPCKFFRRGKGRCREGQQCKFSHDPECREPCKQLLLYGQCRAEACRHSHAELQPEAMQALRQYYLHLEQQGHEKQQQRQQQREQQQQQLSGQQHQQLLGQEQQQLLGQQQQPNQQVQQIYHQSAQHLYQQPYQSQPGGYPQHTQHG